MVIGDRIKQLRTERKWTQAELADRMGIRQKQISAYERGTNIPSAEVLIKMSEAFDVSLDYLAFQAQGQSAKIEVKDRELLRYFEAIDDFNEDERRLVKEMLNLVVLKHKFQDLALSKS
jgi:transcriptional regulator with XRE-family HTH domain